MKLSVSIADDDVAFLDEYATSRNLGSRSAAVQEAVHLLRSFELGEAYAEAWAEWSESDDAALWDQASGDGLGDATR